MRNVELYPDELGRLVKLIQRVSRILGVDRYLLMYVFEVFWSVYFGPIMPWKATCRHCLVYGDRCLGGLSPAICMLKKAAVEARRIEFEKSRDIVVRVEPELPLELCRYR